MSLARNVETHGTANMIPFAWLDRILEWFTPDHLKNDVGMRKRVRMFLISHIFGPMASCPIPISPI